MTRLPRPALLALLVWLVVATPALAQDDDPADRGPAPGAIGQPEPGKRLYDMANVLDNGQEWQIEQDAARLTRHGIPAMVIVRDDDISNAAMASLAADVRREWGVETAPGADDGLVLLVAVPAGEDATARAVVSWGERALPHNGVNVETAGGIEEAWLEANLAEGRVYEAIDHTLRRLVYHAIYDPAPQAPLSDTQAAARSLVSVAGPLLALAVIAAAGARWLGRSRSAPIDRALQWAAPALALAIAALAVWAHSGWGVAAAVSMLAVWAAEWIRRDPARGARPATAGARGPA